jgi:hypothetical protein
MISIKRSTRHRGERAIPVPASRSLGLTATDTERRAPMIRAGTASA